MAITTRVTRQAPTKKHSERKHALLSASTAARWMNCTPSAKLEAEYGTRGSSVYADEGTLAHELAECYLRRDILHNISDWEWDKCLEDIMQDPLFSPEMLDMVPVYTDYCSEQFEEARSRTPGARIEIEQKLDLSEYVPESFGTADCIILADGQMEVIDLKYGKGVPVYAEENKQAMLYGLGALRKFDMMYDIQTLRLTIVQPRLDNISSWQVSVPELRYWAEHDLRPRAELAWRGDGDLRAGDWCRFCQVRARCRKLYEQQIELAKLDFRGPELLSDEEIAEVVLKVPGLVEWANAVAEYALKEAVENDKHWPGLKVVEGRSQRKWRSEEGAAKALQEKFPKLKEEDLFQKKLRPITQIEKLVGKKNFTEALQDQVIKPEGKPCLVPLDDKRPAFGLEQAKLDFG